MASRAFGGGWFIVVATLPTGQVSNHYEAEHWYLFHVSEAVPPMYDGHTPQIAAERLTALLQGPYGDPTAHDPAGCPVCRHALGLPEPATLVLSPEIWCDVCGAWHIPTSCSTANAAETPSAAPVAANGPGMALGDTPQDNDAPQVPLLDEWGRRHEDELRPIGPPVRHARRRGHHRA